MPTRYYYLSFEVSAQDKYAVQAANYVPQRGAGYFLTKPGNALPATDYGAMHSGPTR
jgi:hypothetical protein